MAHVAQASSQPRTDVSGGTALTADELSEAGLIAASLNERASAPGSVLAIHVINAHKIATPFFVTALMVAYQNFSAPAFVYLALHGTYCLMWMVKCYNTPDRRFETPLSAVGVAIGAVCLSMYWIAPFLLIAGGVSTPPAVMGASIALALLGNFLHFGADCQKYFALKLNRGHLITDGFFSRVRNPNYLGEILTYTGFAMMSMHPAPVAVLALVVSSVMLPSMASKEESLSRYPGWEEYKARTGLLFPKLF